MANRYYLKIKDITQETPDAVTISFWHPLNEAVRYQPGQFLTFIIPMNGSKVRRSYSMSSSPHVDASLAVTVKRLPGGLVSNHICDKMQPGDVLETLEPMGHFVPRLDPASSRLFVLIGAGSGITPLFSMMKSILHVEPNSHIWLIYGNRNQESIIYKQHLDAITQVHGSRVKVTHILSQPKPGWTGIQGRINQSTLLKVLEGHDKAVLQQANYYVCGPDGMMDEIKGALSILHVPATNIHKESFATAPPEASGEVTEDPEVEAGGVQEVTILYEGSEYKFGVGPHQTILEAALDLDIDLPYSCQAGMCTACMGRCVSGKVKLDEEDGLSKSELDEGYVLTCVAHPLTRDVVIEIE